MDDQSNRMHNWSWSHQADEKYCDAAEYSMPSECDRVEPYVDSLRQLNKIVERILPETPSHAIGLTKQKLELASSLKRPVAGDSSESSTFATSKRQHVSRGASISAHELLGRKSVTSNKPRCTSTRDLAVALKQERGNDAVNDIACEIIFRDGYRVENKGQTRNLMREVVCSGDNDETNCSPNGRHSATGSQFSSPLAESAHADNGLSVEEKLGSTLFKEIHQSNLPVSKSVIKRATEVVYEKPETTVKIRSVVRKKEPNSLCDENEPDSEEYSDDEDDKMEKSQMNLYPERYSSADYHLDGASCNSDWSPTEDRLNVCEDTTGEEDRVTASDSSVRMAETSRKFTATVDETSRLEQRQSVSKEMSGLNEDDDLKSFTCPHCAYSASKKGQVRKHMSVHGIFLCAHCEFSCEQTEMLEEHRRVHHPGLCGRRLCKKCRILFPGNELESHERQCSGEKQRWACPECSKEFKFLSVMKAHVHKWHPRDCDGEFMPSTTSSTMQSGSSDSGERGNDKHDPREQEPADADQSLPVTSKPVLVVMPSSTEKQYQCEECGKSFKTKWTLSNHAMLAHGANTPFCCDVDSCNGTPFRSDKELNCHRLAVHQLAPRKYECRHPGCTMQFAKYGHFKRHQSTHIGVVPSADSVNAAISSSELKFKCDWPSCTKAFIHQDYLQVHYRRHTDEKPYKCHHCEAAYRQKSGLKYHLDKVHNEKTVGRSGRKRKFAITPGVTEATKTVEPGVALSKESAIGVCVAGVDEKECGSFHSRPSTVGDSIKQKLRENAAAMKKSKEEQLAKAQMAQTTFSEEGEKILFGSNETVKGWSQCDDSESVKWSSNDLPSIDGTPDEDMGSMGLDDDDWLLGNTNHFTKSARSKIIKTEIVPQSESADQDLACSTSDTEPLDEDLCEELRKLTDVINGAGMSPQDIDSRPTVFDSVDGMGSFIDPSGISDLTMADVVPSDTGLHPSSQSLQNESLHHEMNISDGQMAFEQFPINRGMFDVTSMHHGLYSRNGIVENVGSVKVERSPSDETMVCGRSGMFAPTFAQNMANDDCLPGEYYLGADESQIDRFSENRMHYRSPVDASDTFPIARSNNSVEAVRDGIHSQPDYDMSGQAWSGSNSSCWPPRAADSVSSMSGHSSVSNALTPVCSSVGPEFVDNLIRREDICGGSEHKWSSADGDHRWVMRDGLFRGWCDPSQPQVDGRPVLESSNLNRRTILNYSSTPDMQWHMGRQGESAFTPSRLGNNHSAIAGFDVVGRQAASPSDGQQYCGGTNVGSSPMSGRVHESVGIPYNEGYMSGTPDGSWSNFYGRPGSTSSCGDGVYDQYLPHDAVYKSPLTSERFCLPSSVQPGLSTRSYVDYNYTSARVAHPPSGVYGFSRNGYALPQVHDATSPWVTDDFSDDRECRRSLPGVVQNHHRMPYQQSPVLYNVVPRYY